jgi:nucleoside-triphosphatase THEP1
MPRVLIITGRVGAGKSTLLARLARDTRRTWRPCGCLSHGLERADRHAPARRYELELLPAGRRLPWAERHAAGEGFVFRQESLAIVEQDVGPRLEREGGLCLLDELGRLELEGGGLASLARAALASRADVLVLAARKDRLAELSAAFGLAEAEVADLDLLSAHQARRLLLRRIRAADAGRIGAFAGIGGLVEVGLGSLLHAWRVPLKGHFLAYLQNALLVSFGKSLRGRGLARISFIQALLKAFSPLGGRLMPMLYIFLQGVTFTLPVRLLGWGLPAVLLGSVLMAWLTLALWVLVKYLTFGASFLVALGGLAETVGGWFGAHWGLREGALWLFGLKALLALAVGLAAWHAELLPRLRRWLPARAPAVLEAAPAGGRPPLPHRARAALRDLLRWKFLLALFFSVLLIVFFARLQWRDAGTLLLRGLCLSYVGFLLLRSLEVHAVAAWLDRRLGLGMGASLPRALEVLRGREERLDD